MLWCEFSRMDALHLAGSRDDLLIWVITISSQALLMYRPKPLSILTSKLGRRGNGATSTATANVVEVRLQVPLSYC